MNVPVENEWVRLRHTEAEKEEKKKHVEAGNCPAIIASVHYVSKKSRCRLLFEELYVCVWPQSRNVRWKSRTKLMIARLNVTRLVKNRHSYKYTCGHSLLILFNFCLFYHSIFFPLSSAGYFTFAWEHRWFDVCVCVYNEWENVLASWSSGELVLKRPKIGQKLILKVN